MSEHKPQELERLRTQLEAILDAILDQAEKNPDFLTQLEAILGGDLTNSEARSRRRKRKRIDFDAVAFLSNHSVNDLKQYLLDQEERDLPVIAKQEGLKSLSRKLNKEEMVDKITEFVSKTLNQGVSFLKVPSEFEQSSSVPAQSEKSQEIAELTELSD